MDQDMKVRKWMEWDQEEESSIIKMEDIIKGNGKEIKCMVGVNYIMKAEDWHIKVIGVTTNSMDMEKFTTIILSPLNNLSITLTSIFWMTSGFITKEL